MSPSIFGISAAFVILALGFGVIEWLWPAVPRRPLARKGVRTDLIYWFFSPLIAKWITRGAVIVAMIPIVLLVYGKVEKEAIVGFGPLGRQPVWLQAIEVLIIGELVGYWMHRLFHRGRLWAFHAVHHSSTQVDWLSAVRVHPVNEALTRVAQISPFVLLGFNPLVLAGYAPLLTLYAIMLHANVDWTFGPLRYVVASPAFHRWHHTKEAEAMGKNFGGLLPVWDLAFGTFYMPADKRPREFGVSDGDAVAEGFIGQMVGPFRRVKRVEVKG